MRLSETALQEAVFARRPEADAAISP